MTDYKYFAADEPKKLVEALDADIKSGYDKGFFQEVLDRNWTSYVMPILTGDWLSGLGFSGEQQELVKLCVNESRSLIRNLVSLVTRARLNFEPLAQTADATTLFNAKIAKGLCDHIVTQFQLDKLGDEATEIAAVLGGSYIKAVWNPDKGKVYTADDMDMVYSGDIEIELLAPQSVMCDPHKRWEDQDYVTILTVKNRWDLIALHPELTEKIRTLPPARECGYSSSLGTKDNDDDVVVWEFYHKHTPALPDGRIMVYSDAETVYFDGSNEYECIPVVAMIPEPIIHYPGIGYPTYSNLLPLQEMLNHNVSAIATNQRATAVQSILVPEGSNVSINDIAGLNFISYKPQTNVKESGAPTPLSLARTAPEIFNFAANLRQQLETLSGINSALRGNPPPGATSGVAIATLSANAIELNQAFSKSYNLTMEKLMSLVVRIYHKFASVPRTIAVAGKNNTYLVEEFKGSDLEHIHQVVMKVSNPMAATAAGRIQMAQDMLSTGLIKDVKAYLQVVETGSLDSLVESETVELDLIESENDDMKEGQEVLATALDNHSQHILKHRVLIADPAIRRNGAIVGAVLAHIEEHIRLYKESDPALLAMAETGKLPPVQPVQEEELPPMPEQPL